MSQISALWREGRYGRAESLARELTMRCPENAWSWKTLGGLLRLQGRFKEALQAARAAHQRAPDDPELHYELGLIFDRLGQTPEAEASQRRAVQLRPQFAEAHNELGMILERTDRLEEAVTSYHRALAARPEWPGVMSNLAIALKRQGRLDEAEAILRRAIAHEPQLAGAYVNLAGILRDTNRLDEAERTLASVAEQYPDLIEARSNLLFSLNYSAEHSPEYCLAQARRYGEIASRRAARRYKGWTHVDDPTRLRVGILSGDIHSHPVGYFLESVLAHLDDKRIELVGFPTNPRVDALTQRVQPRFSAWRPVSAYSDEALAREIHRDGIHVLLELSGHTANNRLPVLAWKPAPIQVSWLGYFATTGVSEVDYFLADEVSVPTEHQAHFTERLWYLPDTRLCFSPPDSDAAIDPLPALRNRAITFGSFQNLAKLNDRTLALWARVLSAVPDARLRVQSLQLAGESMRARLSERLERAGIGAGRVFLHGPAERSLYLASYAEVDIVLDTMPFPGGTTTCEALWMGVPTITLSGDRLISRQGASLMRAAGLAEWVADSADDFVARAVEFSRDLDRLGELRAGLRERVRESPLFDARRFAANLEAALWQMWEQWRAAR
jgi:protein O-GlcNAc transferase